MSCGETYRSEVVTDSLVAPPDVVRIARRLEEAGFSAWAVGGAVRDALAGGHPKDWDLTTSARPADVQRLFRRTVPVGVEHGTVGVHGNDGRLYEVTTFRRDVETFGRKARVAFAETLEEDLERRDFTINAVAWHPLTGEIRDPHGGCAALRAGVLETVGDPEERFREDRLRVLRALRFAGRFGLRIEDRTWAAILASADHLDHLSAERVREELYKVLDAQTPAAALRLYEKSGVLAALYPELQSCVGFRLPENHDLWTHLIQTVESVRAGRRSLRMAALMHDVGRPRTDLEGRAADPHHAAAGAAIARGVMQRLKASNRETDYVVHLVAMHSPLPEAAAPDPEIRRWIRRVGREFLMDLFRLRFADWRARKGHEKPERLLGLWRRSRRLLAEQPALSTADLAIGGAELRAIGIPAGPLYGEILRDLLERVTDDPTLNTVEALSAIVREQLD
jgi:tRNA nucleotidyltransferase (CCA-adding enzyme)